MKLKKVLVLFMVAALVLGLSACSNAEEPANEETESSGTDVEVPEESPETAEEAPEYENLMVDADNGEITFEAVINGTYFTEPTRHAIVWEDGGNSEKAMFRTAAYNVDFHDALESLGLSGDSNVSMDEMSSTAEDNVVNTGDAIDFFIKWDGQDEIPLSSVIKANEDFSWDTVFAGNRDVAVDTQAGCILCLDSCAAGVSVNALPVGTTAEGKTEFTMDETLLPADGTTVTIIVRPAN